MNALDTALSLLGTASGTLEIEAPTLEDVGKARDNAKGAAKILGAAYDLMTMGVYTVAADPDAAPVLDPFQDPTDYTLSLPEVQTAPARDLLGNFMGITPAAQEEAFGRALGRLDKKVGGGLDDSPWLALWEQDKAQAMESLNFALDHRRPVSGSIPTALEVAGWKGGLQ